MPQNLQMQGIPSRNAAGGDFMWIDNTQTKESDTPQVILPLTQNLLRAHDVKQVQAIPHFEDVSDYVPQKQRDKTEIIGKDGQELPEWMMFTKWGRRPKRRRIDFLEAL
jgi:hypothetical protein